MCHNSNIQYIFQNLFKYYFLSSGIRSCHQISILRICLIHLHSIQFFSIWFILWRYRVYKRSRLRLCKRRNMIDYYLPTSKLNSNSFKQLKHKLNWQKPKIKLNLPKSMKHTVHRTCFYIEEWGRGIRSNLIT